MSQSMNVQLAQLLMARLQELRAERDRLIQQVKTHYGTDFAFSVF